MQRRTFERLAAAVVALLIQIAAVAFLTIVEKRETPISEPGHELAYIQAIQLPALTAHSSTRGSTPSAHVPNSEAKGSTQNISRQADDTVAPSLLPLDAPAVDWERSMRDFVRQFVDDQAVLEKHGPTLNSKPQALVLPDTSKQPHRAGDTEHREGGVVITWLNELCYHAADPLVATKVVCKVRSMSERRSEELAEALEKAVKPKYLSRPLPRPKSPASPDGLTQRAQPDLTIDQ
jgi:hypothetical protein